MSEAFPARPLGTMKLERGASFYDIAARHQAVRTQIMPEVMTPQRTRLVAWLTNLWPAKPTP